MIAIGFGDPPSAAAVAPPRPQYSDNPHFAIVDWNFKRLAIEPGDG